MNFSAVWAVASLDGHPFALPGDSGALVVTEDGAEAVGIVFAVSKDGTIAYICALPQVIAELGGGLKLMSGH